MVPFFLCLFLFSSVYVVFFSVFAVVGRVSLFGAPLLLPARELLREVLHELLQKQPVAWHGDEEIGDGCVPG